jgi:hypothetical protein
VLLLSKWDNARLVSVNFITFFQTLRMSDTDQTEFNVKSWIPIESNPDVLSSFAKKLGVKSSSYTFHDIFGLDEVCFYQCNKNYKGFLAKATNRSPKVIA